MGGGGGWGVIYKTKILVNLFNNWKIFLFLTHLRSRYLFLAIQLYVILRGDLCFCVLLGLRFIPTRSLTLVIKPIAFLTFLNNYYDQEQRECEKAIGFMSEKNLYSRIHFL